MFGTISLTHTIKRGFTSAGNIEVYQIKKTGEKDGTYTLWKNTKGFGFNIDIDISKIDFSKEHKLAEYEYKNNIQDGISMVWYYDDAKVLADRCNFKNGVQDGLFEAFHPNGYKREKGMMKNGYLDGLYESWYLDGSIAEEIIYKDDPESPDHGTLKMIKLMDEQGRNVVLEDDIPIEVWKICKKDNKFVYVKILVPAEAKRVTPQSNPATYKARVEFGKVLEIVDKEGNKYTDATSFVHEGHKLTYIVGEIVIPNGYDSDPNIECGAGINCHKFQEHCDQWCT
jgi:hypothetical protein